VVGGNAGASSPKRGSTHGKNLGVGWAGLENVCKKGSGFNNLSLLKSPYVDGGNRLDAVAEKMEQGIHGPMEGGNLGRGGGKPNPNGTMGNTDGSPRGS